MIGVRRVGMRGVRQDGSATVAVIATGRSMAALRGEHGGMIVMAVRMQGSGSLVRSVMRCMM